MFRIIWVYLYQNVICITPIMVVNLTTWILNLYVLPLAIVRINCTIIKVIEPQRYKVVLCNEILIERI
jgi:hypothetical protein